MPDRPLHHWGPALWAFLHTVTVIDMEEPSMQLRDSMRVIALLAQVHAIIPCAKCAAHFRTFFQTEIEGRDRFQRMELFDLLVEYHNQINQRLGKPIMTREEARSRWTQTI